MTDLKAQNAKKVRLPPRWFIQLFWLTHRRLYRWTRGRLGLWRPKPGGQGAMRLTTIGRRTGRPHAVIVCYFDDGPNLVTMAMNGWCDAEPAWWLNFQAHPDVTVDTVDGARPVMARAAQGAERERLWDRWRQIDKNLDAYAARRFRETAVVVFEPALPTPVGVEGSARAGAKRPDQCRKLMKAVVRTRYGPPDVLRLDEVERPVPHEDEVLIKVHATTITRTDCGLRSTEYVFTRFITGLRHPKQQILGREVAGEVAAVGAAVTEFAVGDQIFGISGSGAHAEFVCVRECAPVVHKPSAMTFDEAAAVCDGACTALSCLRQAELRQGQSIVIYGATGSIGTAAVQLAKHLGADVTAVCATQNVPLVRSLGADAVVDYLEEDFTKNGQTYDVIFDAVGKQSFRRCRGSLKPGGIFLTTDLGFLWHVPILMLLTRWIGTKRAKIGIAQYRKEDVLFLKERIEAGQYRPVIDRVYPLEEVVEATSYVETGQKTGNVVLTVN